MWLLLSYILEYSNIHLIFPPISLLYLNSRCWFSVLELHIGTKIEFFCIPQQVYMDSGVKNAFVSSKMKILASLKVHRILRKF